MHGLLICISCLLSNTFSRTPKIYVLSKDWKFTECHPIIVRFKCNRGALMSGDRTVFCDGHRWNSTRPDCLGGSLKLLEKSTHSMILSFPIPIQLQQIPVLRSSPILIQLVSVPAAAPVLSLEPLHGGSVQVGQRLTFRCQSQGNFPLLYICIQTTSAKQ